MSAKVTFTDKGLKKLQENLRGLGQFSVDVGFLDEKGRMIHPMSVLPIAHIAAIQEFGADDTPERSFMRSVLVLKRAQIAKVLGDQLALVMVGKKTDVEAMSVVGAFVAKLIRDRLSNAASWARPLDADTVAEKGGATPLDQTGAMKAAVGWRVMKGATRVARGQ